MDNMFMVTPMSQRISLDPGETYTGFITIINPADATEDFNYKVTVAPYGVSGKNYDADFITTSNRTQIANWITIADPTGEIAPNGTKKIEFTITVPENASSGGQYASIMVSSNDETGSKNEVAVKNVFEMASLIYADVAGETVHEGEILENNVPGFSTVVPLNVSALLSNSGNVHEDATFVLTVSNFFTGEVILPTSENEGRYSEIIMPESEKYVSREINNLPLVGVVKVDQTIYYNGEKSIVEQNVLICPIWFMLLVLFTIGALITIIVKIVVRAKRKKYLV